MRRALSSRLGTKTSYDQRLSIPKAPSLHKTHDPKGYEPVHMWFLARHGSRWPTNKKAALINRVEHLLQVHLPAMGMDGRRSHGVSDVLPRA